MRIIGLGSIVQLLPQGWEAKAAAATAEVEAAGTAERAVTINKHRDLWRELAPILASLSHKKCWYCESRENRSDSPVDHYRPKGPPVESSAHPGYWWLAFRWENYRYSCTFCNSKRTDASSGRTGGKHNHFPLVNEGARAFDEASIPGEAPLLLDPTRNGDPTLLYFDDEGRATPRANRASHPAHWERADVSISLYHLNHKDIVESRLALFNGIKDLVQTGRTYFDNWSAGNVAAETGYNWVVGRLRELMHEKSEYSAAARDMIRGFRDDRHPWIDGVF